MAEISSSSSTSRPPPHLKPLDLHLTIVSAKHLKNVNWRSGDLKPYVVFWVDPERRLATKSDDSGSTRPVWNERFTIPIPFSVRDSVLMLEIFHSKPPETPKPLVGTLRVPLVDLGCYPNEDHSNWIRAYDLIRPSGRPQGKIRLKIAIGESYNFNHPPQLSSYYYGSAPSPPPPPPRDYYRPPSPTMSPPPPPYGGTYHNPYYHSSGNFYSSAPPPPLPPRPLFDNRTSVGGGRSGYGGGPSAPVDYSPYDNQRQPPQQKMGKMGLGLEAGLAVGGVAGGLGGLSLDDGLKYEDEKIESSEVESELNPRQNYKGWQSDY